MSFIITLSTFSHYAPSHNFFFFFFNDTATTEIYTLSLHDALPISQVAVQRDVGVAQRGMVCKLLRKPLRVFLADRKSTRLNSSHANISYAVFCLKKKKNLFMFNMAIEYDSSHQAHINASISAEQAS